VEPASDKIMHKQRALTLAVYGVFIQLLQREMFLTRTRAESSVAPNSFQTR
jgi:hypothetical protein